MLTEQWKHIDLQWEGLLKAVETNDHFFLYDSAISAITIPKSRLNGTETDGIRAILTAHGHLL